MSSSDGDADPDAGGGDGAGDGDDEPSDDDDGPCALLDCGSHGQCELDTGEAVCRCNDGFIGELCDACDDGLVVSDDGSCKPPCEASGAPQCGEHGSCELQEGAAVCACTHPYAGELCTHCAEGYGADPDDGSCVPDCGDCGPHALCDAEPLVPECACLPGYRDDGDGCRWIGNGEGGVGLIDGSLDDPDAWETHLVVIEGSTATFTNTVVDGECELGALQQTFAMPALQDAQPLVIELEVVPQCDSSDAADCPALQVEVGEGAARLPVAGGTAGATRTLRMCLGEGGYGGDVSLRIRPNLAAENGATQPTAFDCATDTWPAIQRVDLRPAGPAECPLQEHLFNGDFDAAEGWSLSSATVAGGRLQLDADGVATAPLSVPLESTVPSSALRLEYTGDLPGNTELALGELTFARALWAMGDGGVLTYCLPDWARGMVHQLRLRGVGGVARISSLRVETETRCGDGAFDAGFERHTADAPLGNDLGSWSPVNWGFDVTSDAARTGVNGVRIAVVVDALWTLTRVPVGSDAGRAAFSLWHRLVSPGSTPDVVFDVQPFEVTDAPIEGTAYGNSVFCLGRAWEGQVTGIRTVLSLSDVGGVDLDDAGPITINLCD
jgi:hypothetical protein